MDSFSEDFKTWMDSEGFNAETLAPIIGKSPGTIANWRSRGVPPRQGVRDFLTGFMRDYKPAGTIQPENQILIPFTESQYELVEKAGSLTNLGTKEFVRMAATERAREEIADQTHLKVAEDETPYRVNPKGK
jgi:hypothetical protein